MRTSLASTIADFERSKISGEPSWMCVATQAMVAELLIEGAIYPINAVERGGRVYWLAHRNGIDYLGLGDVGCHFDPLPTNWLNLHYHRSTN